MPDILLHPPTDLMEMSIFNQKHLSICPVNQQTRKLTKKWRNMSNKFDLRNFMHYWREQQFLNQQHKKVIKHQYYFQDKYDTNQKWNLCEALLHVGDWPTAQKLIEKSPKYSVLVRENVALALCDLIHRVIDPIYVSKCSVTPSRKERAYTSSINKLSTPQVNFYAMRTEEKIDKIYNRKHSF